MKLNPLFPSILSTNFFDLESRLKIFKAKGIDYLHLDIMDGHFVNNLSFGPSAIGAIKSHFNFKVDSHLMVSNPSQMIPKFIDAGSDWISFHLEATKSEKDVRNNIDFIKSHHRKVGLVLNPDSDIQRTFPYLEIIDYILLMSVFPGYGGQKFISATIERVSQLKEQIQRVGSACLIQVDGGINTSNIGELKVAGADLFVVGTFLYNSEDINRTIVEIENKIIK